MQDKPFHRRWFECLNPFYWLRPRYIWILPLLLLLAGNAAADLTVTPITWDVVGLDHNRPLTSGPELFPVGARVCTDTDTSNAEVEMVWEDGDDSFAGHPYVNSRLGSLINLDTGPLDAGECFDAYFEIRLNRSADAFGESRQYRIDATDSSGTFSSPTPRVIYIERLVSQNRNSTNLIRWGQEADESDWVTLGAGGGLNLAVGETYFVELTTQTATAYEQLQSFLTLSNTIFQVKSVSTTYSTLTAPLSRVPVPNPGLYADGCLWDPDLDSPNYNSCLATGKAGGVVVTTYEIDIIAGGGDSIDLLALIYDKSGGSFHYNTDFIRSPGEIVVNDPSNAGFAKRFIPSTIGADGTATLRFTISNPNPFTVEGYQFTDNLPGNMVVANPANASSTCGGTITANPGSGIIAFEDGVIGANSTCTILVTVTVPFDGDATYPVELFNTADLFVGDAEDPSDTAEATLTVTEEEPPPLSCTILAAGTDVAAWNSFDNDLTPAPTSQFAAGIASAQGGPGLTFDRSNDFVEWRALAQVTGQTLAAARLTNAYYEFRLDTTGLVSVDFRLETFRRNGNAPESITLDYGPAGGSLVQSTTFSPVPTQNSRPGAANFIATGLTNLNPNGDTVFRVYAYGASNVNQPISLLDVLFEAEGEICSPIDPEDALNAPELSKSFNPAEFSPGGITTLTFTLTNPNPTDALSGITFRDELPAGMTSVGGFVNNGCGGTWGLEASDPTILLLTDGALAADGSCSLQVNVISTSVGANVNISDPIDATETLPGNSAIDTLEVLPPPLAPSIAKFFDPNPLLDPDGFTTLVFQITNNDPALAISDVAFVDALPVGMVPVEPRVSDDNGNCGAFDFPYDGPSNALEFSNGSILAGQTCQVEIDVVVPDLDSEVDLPAIFVNETSIVTHVFFDITYEGNQAEATLLVDEPIPGVALLKQVGLSDDPEGAWSNYLAVPLAGQVYYKLTVENIGETVLSVIDVADPDVDTSGCPWEINPNFELPIADVSDPEAHIAVCIIGPVTADTAGVFLNTVTVEATGGGEIVADQDTATYATSELTLVKSADRDVFETAGETINYTFTVTNTGDAILAGPVTITDDLIPSVICPALTTIGNNDNFFDPGEVLECAGSYVTDANDVDAGFVTNVASASTPEAVTDTDEATVTLLMTPGISVSKSADPVSGTTVNAGDTITYSVEVVVADAELTAQFELTDTLGAGLSLGTVTAGTFTCNAVNPLVCTLPSGTVPGTYELSYTATVNANAAGTVGNSVVAAGDDDPECTLCETEHPVAVSHPDINVTFVDVEVTGDVRTNDVVEDGTTYAASGDALQSSPPDSNATLTMNPDGSYSFVADTPGVYVYAVEVCSPGQTADCPTERLTITVLDADSPDANAPVANTDIASTAADTPVTITVLANDEPGAPGTALDPASVSEVTAPANGSIEINPDGTITYTPYAEFTGIDTFVYQVCDDREPAQCATAVVEVVVVAENAPNSVLAADDYAFGRGTTPVTGNVLANDTDPQGNAIAVTETQAYVDGELTTVAIDGQETIAVTDDGGSPIGTLAIDGNGDFTFTAEPGFTGPVNFPYQVCDDGTPTACANATLYILIGSPPSVSVSVSASKSANPADGTEVAPGQTLSYMLSVEVSNGPTTADVVLTDTLGAGLTNFEVVNNSDGLVVAGTNPYTFTLAAGATSGTYTVEYSAEVSAGATVSVGNSVEITQGGGDPTPSCPSCDTEHPVLILTTELLTETCINDAAYVDYKISRSDGLDSGSLTITWIKEDGSGETVEELLNQPLSGRLLWPGTEIDADGNPTDWPGWEFINGEWVRVDDGLRPTMRIRFELNPQVEGIVNYPPATAACSANPAASDPGGPGPGLTPGDPVPIPTLSHLALLLLSILMGMMVRNGPRYLGSARFYR